jgi:hypothetical protein
MQVLQGHERSNLHAAKLAHAVQLIQSSPFNPDVRLGDGSHLMPTSCCLLVGLALGAPQLSAESDATPDNAERVFWICR